MSDEQQVDPSSVDAPAPQPAPPPSATPPPVRAAGSVPLSTVVVGALLVLVLGFGAGLFVGRWHPGDPFGDARRFAHPGMAWDRDGSGIPGQGGYGMPGQGGFGMPGQGGFGMGSAPGGSGAVDGTAFGPTAFVGTVTSVDGDGLTIRTVRGQTVTVHVSSATQVRTSRQASVSDLSEGAPILVVGQPDGSGSFTAVRVIEGAQRTAG